ncbi:hypothetical protein NC652_012428 [Populus alba x Populus x berolinensis]|nr:hypothetical protein NC652_012428 [Populus alba x Populus x berolinensis]
MLMNMFGGLGAGSLAVPNRSNVPPEELYADPAVHSFKRNGFPLTHKRTIRASNWGQLQGIMSMRQWSDFWEALVNS